jgi:lipopolysaccharide/colanic/teichoic acid biosynthesis glycosyltransferase
MMETPQHNPTVGLTMSQRAIKRMFDVVVALVGLALVFWIIVLAALRARRDTGSSGIFRQARIGRDGRVFFIFKIRTMRDACGPATNVTTARDPRITRVGAMLRHWKIDELPQLANVLRGDMSFVGPRPDVPEYLEQIRRQAPLVLSVRPGITGPASLKYRHEEDILASQRDPQTYNDRVIFPDKLRINETYVREYSFLSDLKYLWATVLPRCQKSSLNSIALHDGQSIQAA